MKKFATYMACLAALVGFTACEDDKEPVYHAPSQFVLNTPALQNQYVELTPEGTLTLYASQPDYGVSMITNYSAQMSLTEDFADYVDLKPANAHLAAMTLKQSDIALGLCELKGYTSEETYQDDPAQAVYFRALAEVEGVDGSAITSNVVKFNQVKGYFAVAVPGYIWIVGQITGWTEPSESAADHYADYRLFESADAIGSKVYSGVFNIPADQYIFRFYKELGGWDKGSLGPDENDGYKKEEDSGAYNVFFNWPDAEFENQLVSTKNNFVLEGWPGGKMTIVVDLSDEKAMKVTMMEGEHTVVTAKYMYIVGSNAGWAEPNEAAVDTYNKWRIADTDGSGIYTGTFNLSAQDNGQWYFRIYETLEGWADTPYSADANGANVDIALNQAYQCYTGQGCWVLPWNTDGMVTVTLDTNTNALTVSIPENN